MIPWSHIDWLNPTGCDDVKSSLKYKDGHNRPASVNQILLVHNHDKFGNKCMLYSRKHEHLGNPSVWIGA